MLDVLVEAYRDGGAEQSLHGAVEEFPVMVVTGARQTGASTLAGRAAYPTLATFLEEYPDLADTGVLLYAGEEVEWIADRVLAVPWWRVI